MADGYGGHGGLWGGGGAGGCVGRGGRGAKAKECVKAPTLAEEMICCHFFIHRGEQRA